MILFFFYMLIVSCNINEVTEIDQNIQSDIELSEPLYTNQNIRIETDSLTLLISKTATSFHDWYIDLSNRENNTVPTSAEVVKNENGKCKLDNEPYFSELRKLGTISEKFINNEIARTKECADYLTTIRWKEYQKSEAYEYSDNCPQFYYMYWTNSQDVYSGVIVDDIERKDSKWIVKLAFYNDSDTRYFDRTNQPVVTVENEAGKWMITKIDWLKNE